MKRNIAGALVVLIVGSPITPAYAQDVGVAAGVETVVDTPADPTPIVIQSDAEAQPAAGAAALSDAGGAGTLVDTASSTQDTIPADTLVETEDPSTLLDDTASSTIPIDTASSTDATSTDPVALPLDAETATSTATSTAPILDEATSTDAILLDGQGDTVVEDTASTTPDTMITTEEDQPVVVATMPVTAIKPKAEYKFSIGSSRIATDRAPHWQKGNHAKKGKNASTTPDTVTVAPSVALDATLGVPVVSGNCSKEYFVVLLYKSEDDYNDNPASYILNKAYACENGAYSFAIKDLPQTLSTGTYYLLVGEQGATGSWSPITALVPIDIAR